MYLSDVVGENYRSGLKKSAWGMMKMIARHKSQRKGWCFRLAPEDINIRKIRELNNLTQEYMAEQLKISQSAYSRLEKGEVKADINRLEAIAKIFTVKIEEIINFDSTNFFDKK